MILWHSDLRSQDLKFYRLTTKSGLSQTVVNCIMKDSRGFMWFGTQDGLNRYDGYSFMIFRHDPDNANSLSDNYINCLYEDDKGLIWIGTDVGGLNAYDPVLNTFKHFMNEEKRETSLSDNKVHSFIKDKTGKCYVGTDNGLNIFNGADNNFQRIMVDVKKPKSLIDGSVRSMVLDNNDQLWIGTYVGGLHRFNKSTSDFDYFSASRSSIENISDKSDKIKKMFLDADGQIWIGTYNGGTFLFNPKSNQYVNAFFNDYADKGSISHDWVNSIVEDSEGKIWLATRDSGLCLYDKTTKQFTRQFANEFYQYALSNNSLSSLYCDESGNIWIGTDGFGVNVFFRNTLKFRHYRKQPNTGTTLLDDMTYCIYQDKKGLLWLGSKGGELSSFNRNTGIYTHYKDVCRAKNKTILTIFEDQSGIFWLGSYGGGLSLFKPWNGESHLIMDEEYNGDPMTNKTVLDLAEDRMGRIWIATFGGGIYVLDKATMKLSCLNTSKGLTHNRTRAVYQDKKGLMWVATQGGVTVIDPSEFQIKATYTAGSGTLSLTSNSVYSFYQDSENVMWIATAGGLNKLDLKKNEITRYYSKDGIANDNIFAIQSDKKGNLWFSTNKGITRFDTGKENINGSSFKNYEAIDGLQEGEFLQGSYFRNPETDEMFFGGIDGFNSFLPDKISDNHHVPAVRITSFKRFGKEVTLDSSILEKKLIELSYRDNFFSFEFVSLDYTFPAKNLYSYKMDGVDEDWSAPSSIRYASYTNLEGGDYSFRVKASNNDGVWNEQGAVIHIRVIPPIYKTKTFYSLCVIALVLGIWGFTKWRTKSIEQEKKVLEEKVAERTAELAQKNRDITSSIEYAKRIQEAILPEMKEIQEHLPESFVFFKPKDIVSGDFYWFGVAKGKKIIAAVDCTGHGVPGAFMSMIGNNLLSQIIKEKGIIEPDRILNELNEGVQAALKQGTHEVETRDGMDVALCVIDPETREVQFSGAFRPLVVMHGGKSEKIDGNKFPIGGALEQERNFTKVTRKLEKGDTLYMFSDGYADQFGGDKGKKFMLKKLHELLASIVTLPMSQQRDHLEHVIGDWQGYHDQVDDILVIGIKL